MSEESKHDVNIKLAPHGYLKHHETGEVFKCLNEHLTLLNYTYFFNIVSMFHKVFDDVTIDRDDGIEISIKINYKDKSVIMHLIYYTSEYFYCHMGNDERYIGIIVSFDISSNEIDDYFKEMILKF